MSPEVQADENALEVDDRFEMDSISDTCSVVSDTTSISSSITEYQYENGRRYHNYRSGNYLMPNDEKEQVSLDAEGIGH